jgi:hypothetical protein
MDSLQLLAKVNKQKKAVADRRVDSTKRPETVDNDRTVRSRSNASRGKEKVVQTHLDSRNIPASPVRGSPLNPNSGIHIRSPIDRNISEPPITSSGDIPFTRKRQRLAPRSDSGRDSAVPSWEVPGFVKPTDPVLAMALADEVSNVPALNNLGGSYGEQPPYLGLGLVDRIVNCDTLKLIGEAGESFEQVLSRFGSGLSEVRPPPIFPFYFISLFV